jgi:DNA-binding SARP family transcriptional activator
MNVRAHLFGQFKIEVGNSRIDQCLSQNGLLVFTMLATRPHQTLRRSEVAFTLWPDHTESEALAALRRQIYKLQRALPPAPEPWIRCSSKTIEWGRPEHTWVDVNEFQRLRNDPATAHLAAALYTGDLLPFADHEWIATQREALKHQACTLLEELVRRYFTSGDARSTLTWVEQLLAQDPWREAAMRVLMATRCRLGDRAGALAAYRRFCDRLTQEFGAEPMPETRVLYTAIARGEADAAKDQSRLSALISPVPV